MWKPLKPETLAEPRLVGRSQELEQLQRSLDSAGQGNGTTVFVSGEAGSGKTRLTQEFLNQARNKGITVLTGWCLSNAAVPYFPFLEAFDSYVSANEAEGKHVNGQQLSAKTWLMGPESSQTVTPQAWKDQTFAAVTKELLYLSTINPIILFIDDMHWADSASMSLLHYISRFVGTERVLVLVTFRSEEVNAAFEGHGHQLAETLRLMGREGLYKEIRLSGLSQADVGGIAESMLGGKPQENLVERLATESHGIPLFVVESVRLLNEEDGLVYENGQWRLSIETFSIPAKVKDVILRRIESLKPSQRRVLDAASVIGEKFDPKLVAAVVTQDSLDVLESLNTIAERTLLVYCEANYYRFDHAKSREMLYELIPNLIKEEYHSRIAEKMENLNQTLKKFPASDLAYHFIQASNKEKSVKYALAAGKDALARFSNIEAIRHFTYVVHTVETEFLGKNERNEALQGLGEAYFANSMFEEAMKVFERLYTTEEGITQVRAYRWAMDSAFFKGDAVKLSELTKAAENCASTDRLESARVRMNIGRANLLNSNPKGLQDFLEALRIDEEEYSLPDTARVLIGLGPAYGANRQREKALGAELRAIAIYEELGDLRGQMDAYNRAGQYGLLGLIPEARETYLKAIAIGQKIGDYNRMAEATASLAQTYEVTEEIEEALAHSLKALEYSQNTDSDWTKSLVYANLVRQYSQLGKTDEAEKYYNELMQLKPHSITNRLVQHALSQAVYYAAKTRWSESNQLFDHFFECLRARTIGFPLVNYAWALNRQGRREEAKKQREKLHLLFTEAEDTFAHVNLQAYLMAPAKVEVGQRFEARLDLVNISRVHCCLLRIENLTVHGLEAAVSPAEYALRNGMVDLKEKILRPLQLVTLKINAQFKNEDVLCVKPTVFFKDERGDVKACEFNPVKISTNIPLQQTPKAIIVPKTLSGKMDFKSEASQKVFDYLFSAFKEDYTKRRLPVERSGWRTLMDVAKQGKVSKYSVYGSAESKGHALSELEHAGLVEARFFEGERGRGGKILKVRVNSQIANAEPIE